MEYEEIDIPETTSASAIDTQPNSAYATTPFSRAQTAINTAENVAYASVQ